MLLKGEQVNSRIRVQHPARFWHRDEKQPLRGRTQIALLNVVLNLHRVWGLSARKPCRK